MIQKFTFTVDNDAAELQLLDSWLIIQKISANVSFTRYIFTVYIDFYYMISDRWWQDFFRRPLMHRTKQGQ